MMTRTLRKTRAAHHQAQRLPARISHLPSPAAPGQDLHNQAQGMATYRYDLPRVIRKMSREATLM